MSPWSTSSAVRPGPAAQSCSVALHDTCSAHLLPDGLGKCSFCKSYLSPWKQENRKEGHTWPLGSNRPGTPQSGHGTARASSYNRVLDPGGGYAPSPDPGPGPTNSAVQGEPNDTPTEASCSLSLFLDCSCFFVSFCSRAEGYREL